MKVKTCSRQVPVTNHDNRTLYSTIQKHGEPMGGCKLAVVAGRSGCGKTSSILSGLYHVNGFKCTELHVASKSLHQPQFQFLGKVFEGLNIPYITYDSTEDICPISQAKVGAFFLFDDIVCDKQSRIRELYCFGRHKNIDSFYLSQTYSAVPKQLIRDNANFIMLFRMDHTNLKHVYDEHVNVDMTYEKFKELCAYCWKKPYGFMAIDKERDLNDGRYREGYHNFIII